MTRGERAIGIALGIVLGITIVILFVFLGGDETIDAPSIEATETTVEQSTTQPRLQSP
jgi:hypothetical protein